MKHLPRLARQKFPGMGISSAQTLENHRGELFLLLTSFEKLKENKYRQLPGTHVYRWAPDGAWAHLSVLPGRPADLSDMARNPREGPVLDDPDRDCFRLLSHEGTETFLLQVDYGGRLLGRTPLPGWGWTARFSLFPGGDILLREWGPRERPDGPMGFRLARFSLQGEKLWERFLPRSPESIPFLTPAEDLIFWPGPNAAVMDGEGNLRRTLSGFCPAIGIIAPFPAVYPAGEDWILEYQYQEQLDQRASMYSLCCGHYCRVLFDREGREKDRQEAAVRQAIFATGRFLPDGVLSGTARWGRRPVQMLFTPFGGETRVVYEGVDLAKNLCVNDICIPPIRCPDGSYVFSFTDLDSDVWRTLVLASPEGETLWSKKMKIHGSGKRWVLVRENRLVIVMAAGFGDPYAETYQLP